MMKRSLTLLFTLLIVLMTGLTGCFSASDSDPGSRAGADTSLIVKDVRVHDMDGRLAFQGDVDLAPELARIERGERDPHRNDGSVFQNREGRLPARERGYYREYVVRTPGIRHAGPQRLVIGQEGEVYYTADHYRTFTRIR
ncbi:ribonuclease [Ectothiorhodospira shaposhnikovii]|uniref:ribonuclease domain-containing protein n=1 Tax=Ectothiorhodospira shaposhnikovii TaxID=1054 RepID=UPI001905F218|nr:ribonuclease domain-containing protein [Ectothiorhodospira shaposhnikovii]MBK1671898.1 ribonuclease [Ectothiorhodospira shaposhnikovii]